MPTEFHILPVPKSLQDRFGVTHMKVELTGLVGGAIVWWAIHDGATVELTQDEKDAITVAYVAHDKIARPEYYEVRHGGKDAARGIKHSAPKAVHYRPGRRA